MTGTACANMERCENTECILGLARGSEQLHLGPVLGRKTEEAGVRLQRDLYTLQRHSVGSGKIEEDVRQEGKKIIFF